MFAILKRHDFRLLFLGTSASAVGDSLLFLVLAIWVKDLTGSDSAAGLTMFCLGIPYLLSPLAGLLVDRVRRRPFLVGANLVNAIFLVPLAFVHDAGDVWLIYLTAVLLGLGGIVDGPAINGLMKALLPDELLADANGANQTVRQGLRLVGPLLGAGIFTMAGGFAVAMVDLAGFLLAALAIGFVKVSERRPEPSTSAWRTEIASGFTRLLADVALRRAAAGMFLAACAFGAVESVSFALTDKGLGQPAEFVSIIVTVMGVGGLTGGLIASRVVRRVGELAAEGLGLMLGAVCLAVWIIPTVPTVLIVAPIMGLALPIVIVADNTLVQRRSPDGMVGRVSAAADLVFTVPQMGSIALGAALVAVVDYRFVLVGMAVVMAVAAGYLLLGRRLTVPVRDSVPVSQPVAGTEPA